MSNDNPKIEVRDLRDGDWLWTHKAILFSPHISPAEFKVYCALCAYAGNTDQRAWPSIITLGERLNISRPTIMRALKMLEECGVLAIERKTGMLNIYSLLSFQEVRQPQLPMQAVSPHRRLIQFFHTATQKFRSVKPTWSVRDTARLKYVLDSNILGEIALEQLMLYFLASGRFKKFSPSMATFLSSGIFNGLMNAMQNDREFWKELDGYSMQMRGTQVEARKLPGAIPVEQVMQLSKMLSQKMAIKSEPYDPRR